MAFSDPVSLFNGGTAATFTGATATNWRRVRDGEYVADVLGSWDEPYKLFISSSINNSGVTIVTCRVERHKNPPAGTYDPTKSLPKDDYLKVSWRIEVVNRSFTAADIISVACNPMSLIFDAASLGRMLKGER